MHLFTDYYFYSYCRVVWSKLPNAGKQRRYAILSPSVRPEKLTLYLHAGPRDNISITAGIICCCNSPAIPNTRILARPCVAQIAAFFFVSLDCLELAHV